MAEIVPYKHKDFKCFFSLSGKHIQIILRSHLPIADFDHLSNFCQMLALLVMICNTQSFS